MPAGDDAPSHEDPREPAATDMDEPSSTRIWVPTAVAEFSPVFSNISSDPAAAPPQPDSERAARAEAFKAEGNALFKRGQHRLATAKYTNALHYNPSSAALYSNRCASWLALKCYPRALNDANRAVKLDENWDKAWFRLGKVHEAMQLFTEARGYYHVALQCCKATGKPQELPNIKQAIANVKELAADLTYQRAKDSPPAWTTNAAGPAGQVHCDTAEAAGMTIEEACLKGVVGVAGARLGFLHQQFVHGMTRFHPAVWRGPATVEGQVIPPGGSMFIFPEESYTAVQDISNTLIEDDRAFHFKHGDADFDPTKFAEKMQLFVNALPSLGGWIPGKTAPHDILEQCRQRLQGARTQAAGATQDEVHLYKEVRAGLMLSLRAAVLLAHVFRVVFLNYAKSAAHLRWASTLMRMGREELEPREDSAEAYSVKGMTFKRSFERRTRLLLAKVISEGLRAERQQQSLAGNDVDDDDECSSSVFSYAEMDLCLQWVMDDAAQELSTQSHGAIPGTMDCVNTYYDVATAMATYGQHHNHRARRIMQLSPLAGEDARCVKRSRIAAVCYQTAAKYTPLDDEHRATWLLLAITFGARGGRWSWRQVGELARALVASEAAAAAEQGGGLAEDRRFAELVFAAPAAQLGPRHPATLLLQDALGRTNGAPGQQASAALAQQESEEDLEDATEDLPCPPPNEEDMKDEEAEEYDLEACDWMLDLPCFVPMQTEESNRLHTPARRAENMQRIAREIPELRDYLSDAICD